MIRLRTIAVAAAFPLTLLAGAHFDPAHAASYKIIYQFGGAPADGAYPSSLIAKNGTLYGTAKFGGANNAGTVFKLTPQGSETTIYTFPADASEYPNNLVTELGDFYVASSSAVSTITAEGVRTRLFAPLPKKAKFIEFLGLDGTLLAGFAYNNNSGKNGEVFTLKKYHNIDIFTNLYSFQGGADGGAPSNAPVNVNGTLYGTAYFGGQYNDGAFFSVSPTGVETVLHSFDAGSGEQATQLLYANGLFYTTLVVGNTGQIVSFDMSGNETILHTFTADEGAPVMGLTNIGTTLYGGTFNEYYSMDAAGNVKALHKMATDYGESAAPLVYLGGSLFGISNESANGFVFKITP